MTILPPFLNLRRNVQRHESQVERQRISLGQLATAFSMDLPQALRLAISARYQPGSANRRDWTMRMPCPYFCVTDCTKS